MFQIAPSEPTETMISHGIAALAVAGEDHRKTVRQIYFEMLAAKPANIDELLPERCSVGHT